MYRPSQEALDLFPGLAPTTRRAAESDLCLAGQEEAITSIADRFRYDLTHEEETDVLRAITRIWDVGRHGICRGAQLNEAGPRVRMNAENMPYPLERGQIRGALARRVFPFDPRTPLEAPAPQDGRDLQQDIPF